MRPSATVDDTSDAARPALACVGIPPHAAPALERAAEQAFPGARVGWLTLPDLHRSTGAATRAIVLGPDLAQPLRVAQRLQLSDPALGVIVLVEPGDLDAMARALRFTPFVSPHVACLALDDGPGLVEALARQLAGTSRRRRADATLAAIQPVAPQPADDHRLTWSEWFHHVVEHLPIGVAVTTADGRVVTWSRVMSQLLDVPSSRAIGSPLAPRFGSAAAGRVRQLLERPRSSEPASTTLSRGGRDLEVTVVAVTGQSGDPGVLVMVQDRTEQRQLTRQLHEWQTLETVGRLAGGVAHDFNNLLTVIGGQADLLAQAVQTGRSATSAATEIRRASKRAAELTAQLLAFGRRQTLQPRRVDLNALISARRGLLKSLLGERVEVQFIPGQIGDVVVDDGQFERAFLNIVLNARDAMPSGGTFTIETDSMLSDAPQGGPDTVAPGRYARVSLTDTGVGMTTETRAHVFEPFFTTKDVGEGTGLGLASAFGIIGQSHGTIQVESEPGQGSTFRILLPEQPRNDRSSSQPRPTGTAMPTGHETVLVVEDDEQVCRLVCELLTGLGYHVLQASNGQAALDAAEQHAGAVDVLIADVVLPEISGIQVAERLLASRPRLSVVLMSGYASAPTRLPNDEAPSRFLRKPFTAVELASAVRQAADYAGGPSARADGA